MAKRPPTMRLFVAIYPPIEIACAALSTLANLDLPDHRATPDQQIHMTVQFIGDTPVTHLDAVIETTERAAAGLNPFDLTPIRFITLPKRRPARLVALETDAPPPLVELHTRLAGRLAHRPRPRPSDRFLPHMTLCRFRQPGAVPGLTVDHPVDLPSFHVRFISLVRSTLQPTGAVHNVMARAELG
ncbi:MAG: RNA 2',3'-cyclic phosphodiesterase [Phycisphaerales bacterium]|nr:RNA 2',3'-cyclic phosphodiesterase [Phycisphaerales bacterium]